MWYLCGLVSSGGTCLFNLVPFTIWGMEKYVVRKKKEENIGEEKER